VNPARAASAAGQGPERRLRLFRRLHGIRLFVLSFAGLVTFGALGFLALPGLYTGPRLGVVDAFFTAASAVCVTGLIVVDTATYFTGWGQAWILVLIQVGGLGILTFATLILQLAGGRGPLELESATGSGIGVKPGAIRRVLLPVLATTFAIEAVGATGLWLLWRAPLGSGAAVWPAVFHAISAFCNAGFSTFTENLAGWRTAPPVLLTLGGLIVLGGLGFVVVEDLRTRWVRRRARRLSTHSRVTLGATAVLLLGGAAVFLLFETSGTLAELGFVDRVVNALFMAATPRTAGFNTVDYGSISDPGLVLTVALMYVGGAPGSTAGGIKVTTAALLVLAFWARLRGRAEVAVGRRTVRGETVASATSLAVGAIGILATAIFLLLVVEHAAIAGDRTDLVRLVFEAHSAFGTVGLSMGRTADLTPAGRVIITLLMFVGRVGPVSLAAAMAVRAGRRAAYRYSYDEVAVG
jgi:trk system potassium uptake protein TrkH